MRRPIAILAACAAVCVSAAPSSRPLVPQLDAAAVTRLCDEAFPRWKKSVAAMDARKGAGAIFDEWNRLQIDMEDVIGPVYFLNNVHPDKSVRDAAEPCILKQSALSTEIFQDEKLFARVKAAKPANARQAKLRKDLMEGFEDSGVALPPEKRARAKEIFDRLDVLAQEFERAVRDDATTVTFSPAEMEGLPEDYLKSRKRDDKGNYVLGLDYPAYFPFIQNAKDAAARKRYYVAKQTQGGAANLDRLEEMFRLRKELAGLYGLPTFAHYALRRRMAQTPEAVLAFLGDVRTAVLDLEKRDLEELRTEKSMETGTALADTRLERWDVSYYQEKVRRQRYAIDQEKLRRYFPTARAVDFTLAVSQRLYGVKFTEVKVPAWHEDVRYFDVADAKSGRFISGFYLDLFPRVGKYEHAAAFPIRVVSTRAGRTPLAALVTNFNREGLNHEELEVLMHEFGHVLHNVLSRAEYNPQGGSAVKRDFVEAPSQMFEEWARREQTLAIFREVCAECPQLSREDIERLEGARKYGKGIYYARQLQLAAFDMALSTDPKPPLAVWRQMEEATPLGFVEGTMFPAAFAHLASGYPAGYYGYMWSEVLALDMLSAFGDNLMDAKVGQRYRETILAPGSQEEESALVRRFLGREPSSKAFFDEVTGKR
jgi:thimet oligopeptidase